MRTISARQRVAQRAHDTFAVALVGVLQHLTLHTRPSRRCCPSCECLLAVDEPCPNTHTNQLEVAS